VDLVKFRMRDVEKSNTLGLISYEIYISENRTVCSIILVAKMQYSKTGLNPYLANV